MDIAELARSLSFVPVACGSGRAAHAIVLCARDPLQCRIVRVLPASGTPHSLLATRTALQLQPPHQWPLSRNGATSVAGRKTRAEHSSRMVRHGSGTKIFFSPPLHSSAPN